MFAHSIKLYVTSMELCTANISDANVKIIRKGQGIYSFDMYGFAKVHVLTNDGTTLTRLAKVRHQKLLP